VAKKEAALERQIREQTRLLLQLKAARSQRGGPSDVAHAAPASDPASSGRPAIPTEPVTTGRGEAPSVELKAVVEGR